MKLNLRAAFAGLLGKTTSPFWQAWLRGSENDAGSGAALVSAYQQSVWVYSAVNAVAAQIANTPFCVTQGRGRGERKVESGPLAELFRRPHPQCSRFEFWELLVAWLQIRGEAFLVPMTLAGEVVDLSRAGARAAKPQMFALLDAACFRHDVVGGHLLGWHYTNADTSRQLDTRYFLPGEVIHIRRPNPFDFWRGLSPLTVAHLAASADYASAQFHKGLMLNNADTGLVVTTDQQPDEAQRDAMLAALRERKRRAGTADRPLFLWGGAKVEKPSVSSADLQFLENRKFNRQEICAVFGVPQEVIGFTEDANRSVSDSARLNFIENTCAPLGERLEAAFEPLVRAFGPELYAWFDFDALPVMQAARRTRADVAVKYFSMGVPMADINETFDLGLPDREWYRTGYLPFSVQPVGNAAATPMPPTGADQSAPVIDDLAKLFEMRNAQQAARPKAHVCAASGEYEASIEGAVRVMKARARKFFFEQRARVLRELESVVKARSAAGLKPRALGDDIFDDALENEAIKASFKPVLLKQLEFGGAQLWQEFGLGDFTLPPKAATDYLAKAGTRWEEINGLTHTNLRETLIEALDKGESFEQMAERVRAVFDAGQDIRAETIALTETNTAINAGRHEGLMESPLELKVWMSANLENSRPEHQDAGERYATGIPKDEPFVLANGAKLMFPGDSSLGAGPGDTINCKCHMGALSGAKSLPAGGRTTGQSGRSLLTWTAWSARNA